MNVVVICFLLGVLFLALEVFVPGGILGVLGCVALVVGCIAAFRVFGEGAGVMAMLAAVSLAVLTFYLEFVVLPKSALGKAVAVNFPSEVADKTHLKELLGKSGHAETMLAPSGYVLIEGVRHEALSQSGMVSKGVSVRVVGVDAFRLLVNSTNNKI